jgi:3-oxoacyl-[acyl-carrier protein] reductase
MTASPSLQTAIVTGSSRGIGRAVALELARQGFAVTVNGVRGVEDAAKVAEAIQQSGGRAIAVQADVADPAGAQRLFDRAEREFGGVDAVVNSAGVIGLKPVAELTADDFNRVIRVNVNGTFNMLHLAANRLRDGGSIVNFSTSALATALPGYAAYNASKAAVEAMTRVVSKELGRRGITVNAIAPGPVDTEMFFQDKNQELVDRLIKMTPLGRLGKVEDIAPLVAFLVGPEARWVSGQVLRANGGLG